LQEIPEWLRSLFLCSFSCPQYTPTPTVCQGDNSEKLSRIEHNLIKEVHPQVSEIKEGVEEMIAVVKENSENNPPASKKKGH
jgi:hypothetical protein